MCLAYEAFEKAILRERDIIEENTHTHTQGIFVAYIVWLMIDNY